MVGPSHTCAYSISILKIVKKNHIDTQRSLVISGCRIVELAPFMKLKNGSRTLQRWESNPSLKQALQH